MIVTNISILLENHFVVLTVGYGRKEYAKEVNFMMAAPSMQKVVVLRSPEEQGNYRYWLAELTREDARRWQERLTKVAGLALEPEIGVTFGESLTLSEVMEKLEDRADFQVLDVSAH